MMLNKICSFIHTLRGMRFAGRRAGLLRYYATTHTVRLKGDTVIWETDNGSRRFDLDTLQYIYLDRSYHSDALYVCLNEDIFIHQAAGGLCRSVSGAFRTLRFGRQRLSCLPQR